MIAINESSEFLRNIVVKAKSLILMYDDLKKENQSIKIELEETKALLEIEKQKVKDLEDECVSIKMSKILSITDEETNTTINRLSKIEREIEKCIALLNE